MARRRRKGSTPTIQLLVDEKLSVQPVLPTKEYPKEIQRLLGIIKGDTESVLKHLKREYNR